MPSISDHVLESNRQGIVPKDPFSHKALLIQREDNDVRKFQQMARREILLANIDKKLIRFYQNEVVILTELFSCVQREPNLFPFFEEVYNGFILELNLTRAVGGEENKAQHAQGGYRPTETMGYYPEEMPPSENIFDKFRNRQRNQEGGEQR